MLEPTTGPADQHLWNLLASHGDLCLVTDDGLLLQYHPSPAPMLTGAEFMQRMTTRGVHEPQVANR